jgi:hypothetical protein
MRSAFPPMGCTLRGRERSANHRAPSKVGACFEHQPARGSTVFPGLWQSVCVAVVWRQCFVANDCGLHFGSVASLCQFY